MEPAPHLGGATTAPCCESSPFQFLGVCRHAERADDMGALVEGLPWCLLEDSKHWPYDPPLSDAGLRQARELGLKFRKMLQELDADLHVVITSPFLRCVQTAAMICQHFGRGTKLLIDNSLAEIYGPCIMGDAEPEKPVRPLQQSADFCSKHGVENLEVRRLVGKWPSWPETLRSARGRFATRFVEYLKRGHKVCRNFLLVSHADCVGGALTLIPGAGHSIEKVHFGGHFIAFRHKDSEQEAMPSQPISLSSSMLRKATRTLLTDIDLIVYDMAGTTVQEGGIVYKTLQSAMREDGLTVSDEEMHAWHGAKKEAVIEHFALKAGTPPEEITERVTRIGEWFVNAIDDAYFNEAAAIDHIDIGLLGYFRQLKDAGIKIAFDTGYPENIQQGLIKRLGFDKIADAYISSYQVSEGRPYPYMIHHLMEQTKVMNVKRVCKVGDSVRDIQEGRNAGCGLVVGVLSGADSYQELMDAGAHMVCDRVTDIPVPLRQPAFDKQRLPDFS